MDQQVAQCSETNKSFFFHYLLFLVFWDMVVQNSWYSVNFFLSQRCVLFWNGLTVNLTNLRFLVFEIWSILYSQFLVNWRLGRFLRTWLRNANQWYPITSWLGGSNLKASGARGRSPSWNRLRGWRPLIYKNVWIRLSPKPIQNECWVSQIDHISKTKNRKILFSLVSEYCATF